MNFFNNTFDLIDSFADVIDLSIGVLSAIALLVFIWGIVKYMTSAGSADKAKEGKSIMIYGVIALFVLFSVWGLVYFIQGELGIPGGNPPGGVNPPTVNF